MRRNKAAIAELNLKNPINKIIVKNPMKLLVTTTVEFEEIGFMVGAVLGNPDGLEEGCDVMAGMNTLVNTGSSSHTAPAAANPSGDINAVTLR